MNRKSAAKLIKLNVFLFLLIVFCPFLISACSGSAKVNSNSETTNHLQDLNTQLYYQEKKEPYTVEIPFQDFSSQYGKLKDYHITDQNDAVFLYVKETFSTENKVNKTVKPGPDKSLQYKYHIIRYEDQKKSYYDVPLNTDKTLQYLSIKLSPEGTILLFEGGRAHLFDEKGEEFQSFPAFPEGGILFGQEGEIICKTYSASSYAIFNSKTGQKTGDYLSEEFLYSPLRNEKTFLSKSDETELLVTGSGLYEKLTEGWTLKIPSERTSMYLSDFHPVMICKDSNDEFTIGDQEYLYHYAKRAADASKQISLKVVSCEENNYLKNIILLYQIENPDIHIEYEYFTQKAPSSKQEINLIIQKANAQISSGNAGDIYLLDYLPWESYQERGYLLNIKDCVSPYEQLTQYQGNVLNGASQDENLYAVPLFFNAQFLLAQNEIVPYIKNIHTLSGYLEQNKDARGLVPYLYQNNAKGYFLPQLYNYYQKDLYGKDGLTEESVRTFLESAKIIYDRLNADTNVSRFMYPLDFSLEGILTASYLCLDEAYAMMGSHQGDFMFFTCMGRNAGAMPLMLKNNQFELISTGNYIPWMLTGIHSKTKHPDASKSFLSYMIRFPEKRTQRSGPATFGIPVYLPALEQYLDTYRDSVSSNFHVTGDYYFNADYGDNFPIYFADSYDKEQIHAFMTSVKTPVKPADKLINRKYAVLGEYAPDFLDGKSSLEDTVRDIVTRIQLMEDEK